MEASNAAWSGEYFLAYLTASPAAGDLKRKRGEGRSACAAEQALWPVIMLSDIWWLRACYRRSIDNTCCHVCVMYVCMYVWGTQVGYCSLLFGESFARNQFVLSRQGVI